MASLTCAELLAYPGNTLDEKLAAHHEESLADGSGPPANIPAVGAAARPARRAHGALSLGKVLDLRRFTGRDRIDRIANYLRAHVPRTESWGHEELRACAAALLPKVQIIE